MLHSILLIPFSVFRDHRWSAAENEIQQAKKKKKEKIGESHFELHSFPWPASLLEQETRTRPGLLAADLQAWISFMKRRSHKDDLFFFVTPLPSFFVSQLPPPFLLLRSQLRDLSSSPREIYQDEGSSVKEWTRNAQKTHWAFSTLSGEVKCQPRFKFKFKEI